MNPKTSLLAAIALTIASCAQTPTATSTTTSPQKNCGIKYGDGFIVFEAEATSNAVPEKWVVRREGNSGYSDIMSEIPSVGGTYLEYVGGVNTGLNIAPGQDVLEYKFTPTQSGAYRLTGRMGQQLNQPEGTAAGDHCNDIYVKMEGNFTSGNSETPIEVLQEWNKFYGRGYNQWGAFTMGDVNHAKYFMTYQLSAGEEYTFSISGRSKGVAIDYMLLTSLPIEPAEHTDLASICNAEMLPTPVSNGKYSSIAFDKFTGWDGDFVDASIDPWRNVLQIADRLKWGAAETEFKGESGTYTLRLNTLVECDGESSFKVYIDGALVGEATNLDISKTELDEYSPYSINMGKVTVKNGATLRVEFSSATNGLIPEGDLTATSRGRWQSLDFE